MLVIEIATVPVLLNVIVCAALVVPTFWLPKARLVVENSREAMPVPVRLTVCGLLLALSEMLRKALRTPAWVGWNWSVIVQLAPGAKPAVQLLL